MAREKALRRQLAVPFLVADALQLQLLNREFPTVFDCGLFHTFDASEKEKYAKSIATVTARGGHLYVLCFSDNGATQGPHPVSQVDLRSAFNSGTGWNVTLIVPEYTYARFDDDGIPAWLATRHTSAIRFSGDESPGKTHQEQIGGRR
jgi:SAM-dependent methyltransferase